MQQTRNAEQLSAKCSVKRESRKPSTLDAVHVLAYWRGFQLKLLLSLIKWIS